MANLKKQRFLAALEFHGAVGKAATACGVSRVSHWRWMRTDAEYAADVAEALERHTEAFIATVRERCKREREEAYQLRRSKR